MGASQIVKWGNSLAVRIPKPVAQQSGFAEGDNIVIEADGGEIKLRRREGVPSLKELISRITPENRHGETLSGPEVGKEIAEW
ncbi:MAG TPA: AbrB/MazE/SpoVT family DNA-binding domain-containing protein [Terriglobales bacterium]|jgi:antitoxin MazE